MLTIIVFTPLIAALVLFFRKSLNERQVYKTALAGAGASLFLVVCILLGFDTAQPGLQFVATSHWVPALHINYQVGVDGISVWLVALTAFLSVISIVLSKNQKTNLRFYLGLLLLLETGTLGVFVALDTILFYVFWELMLVPTYFLIGLWGEGKRVYATLKFVIFTLVGSLLMLVAIIALSVIHFEATHELTFEIRTLVHTQLDPATQLWMFAFFFMAFAIKMPIFPFHSWLPHTYLACPIPVLIMLTGAMSKTGAYGLIRFCLPLFPEAIHDFGLPLAGLAAVGMVYGAWIAIMQKDIKAVVAYSSISHLGFIALGILAFNTQGVEGSVLQMVNHGIIASALFIIVGILEQRLGTRNLNEFCGLKKAMPVLYGLFMLITLAALGLPGLNGFVGEFLILMGVWESKTLLGLSVIYVLMGGLAIVFASIYMLFLFQGAMQESSNKLPGNLKDINKSEVFVLLPACVLVVFIGLYPKLFVDKISPSAQKVLHMEKLVHQKSEGGGGGHH